MNNEPLGDLPFSYHSSWGSTFKCPQSNFRSPVTVHTARKPKTDSELNFFARDVAEMIGYHAANILPELNGFRGYSSMTFQFRK